MFSCHEKNDTASTKELAGNLKTTTDTANKNNFRFPTTTQLADSSKLERISKIKNSVLNIDQFIYTDSVYLENEGFMENMTDGGGSLTGFFWDGRLVKMKVWIGLSWGVWQDVYYFENQKLIYVLEREDYFVVDDKGTDHSKFDQRFRGDFYFRNNKMFSQLTLGHNRFEIDANDPEIEFLKNAEHYKKILARRRNERK